MLSTLVPELRTEQGPSYPQNDMLLQERDETLSSAAEVLSSLVLQHNLVTEVLCVSVCLYTQVCMLICLGLAMKLEVLTGPVSYGLCKPSLDCFR